MKRAIAWFAENSVAANLLMALIVVGGVLALPVVKLEIFPEMRVDSVSISVPYPGASPEEVEQAICVRIEERIQGVDGVKEINCTAVEGMGAVLVHVADWANVETALDDIKAEIDSINTFPAEAEVPTVKQAQLQGKVVSLMVSGNADERTLRALGEEIRDEIVALENVSMASLTGVRPFEISVEVSENDLRRFGLRFDDIVDAIRKSSLDLPAGSIKTRDGEVVLRTRGQAYLGNDFEDIVVVSQLDGTRVLLGDIATVVDGFAETTKSSRFDGDPAVMIKVMRAGTQDALSVADAVKTYVAEKSPQMPAGTYLTIGEDESEHLRARLDTMISNARLGFLLVLCVLALFLRLRLAFWVGLGVPIAMLGAIASLPWFGVSINLLSLTAFIVVLGILVDDAIVVGENVHTHQERGGDPLQAAISGTQEVAVPVTFGILTTIAAFSPLLFLPGSSGEMSKMVPIVVISSLVFSMIESKLILPAHLGHARSRAEKKPGKKWKAWENLQTTIAGGLENFLENRFTPFLEKALEWRYTTLATGVAILTVTLGLMTGGWVRFDFMPSIEADAVVASITLPEGTPATVTARAVQQLEDAASQLREEIDSERTEKQGSAFKHVFTSIGSQPNTARSDSDRGRSSISLGSPNKGEVQLELVPSKQRSQTSLEVGNRWREITGEIPDVVALTYTSSMFSSGAPIEVELRGNDGDALAAGAEMLKEELRRFPGIFDLSDSLRIGKQELNLDILPSAEVLGLSRADLARQVRQAFYGDEAQRIQRGRDDVRVMVRYPEEERRSIGDVESMRIRLPDGTAVPLSAVATIESGRGFSTIQRSDRERTAHVTADLDTGVNSATNIVAEIRGRILPMILDQYPSLSYRLQGEQKEQAEFLTFLARGFGVALLVIFGLLAIPLRSYLQPLIIMSAIPFGMTGGVLGHVMMNVTMSMFSVIGLVAVAGVVVNDSLVLVDYINRERLQGTPLSVAVREAGRKRFRPILLTSLTTFAGLSPLLAETSVQAQFLIPMAISLAFGVLFATPVTLLLVPSLYLAMTDVKQATSELPSRLWRHADEEAPANQE
ncbi:MAG: efflux RND transporter permease subunit [Candidatus Binatia bacterium]|nr:efflux RND transporter permease subunit [Candidatus Binatia bacterium]MDG1957031.1 efflux RND transporter permease subunit [Candidatus Binatia bacterium]MDG2011729.1 efflux RND transporter permease subunit [Candidatus Binatia bacterium]